MHPEEPLALGATLRTKVRLLQPGTFINMVTWVVQAKEIRVLCTVHGDRLRPPLLMFLVLRKRRNAKKRRPNRSDLQRKNINELRLLNAKPKKNRRGLRRSVGGLKKLAVRERLKPNNNAPLSVDVCRKKIVSVKKNSAERNWLMSESESVKHKIKQNAMLPALEIASERPRTQG